MIVDDVAFDVVAKQLAVVDNDTMLHVVVVVVAAAAAAVAAAAVVVVVDGSTLTVVKDASDSDHCLDAYVDCIDTQDPKDVYTLDVNDDVQSVVALDMAWHGLVQPSSVVDQDDNQPSDQSMISSTSCVLPLD